MDTHTTATSTHAIGRDREHRASEALIRRGYRIVERNFRCKAGELDLVAYDGDALVFVEVRSRTSARFGGALSAISARKQQQVARIASFYLSLRRPRFTTCRFDVVAITGDELVLVRDAFRVG